MSDDVPALPLCASEADLVTAHEFGHNWGSEHDPDNPECSPSASKGGSYLMYTYSVSGYDLNNKVCGTGVRLFSGYVVQGHLLFSRATGY